MVIGLLAIIATSLLMFHRTLKYGYVMDDTDAVGRHNQRVSEKKYVNNLWRDLWDEARGNYYMNSKREHAISLSLHTLNCCLIYLLFGHSNVALLAALLFCINPANNEGAVWLSAKSYSLTTTIVLVGLLVPFVFPFLYPLTYFWSANAILSPIIFVLKDIRFLPLLLLLPIYAYILRGRVVPVVKERYNICPEHMKKIDHKKLIIALKTYGYYIRFAIFPMRIGLCHSYLSTFGMSVPETVKWYKLDRYFWLGVLVVLAHPILLISGANIFGLLWFDLFIAQWLNILTVNHLISARYLYLANVGLMLFFAQFIMGTFGFPLALVVLTFYATRLWLHLPAYYDYIAFWKSNSENFPDVAMAYNQYGLGLVHFGNHGTALDVWIRGVQERPVDFRLNYNIANLFVNAGKINESVRFIKQAELSLDHKIGGDFWQANIDKLKNACKEKGMDIDKYDMVTNTFRP